MNASQPPPLRAGAVFEVFFDGECPLCMREIQMLRRRDTDGQLAFTDIAGQNFDPTRYGKTQAELMGSIHGRGAGGQWHSGVEVFRHLYGAIGFDRLVAMSRLPGLRQGLDLGYRVFARFRLPLTGRKACDTGSCATP